ncbi:hypothetical protein BGX38DRAFT_251696 [Terfezia claveryi]|nr:hypothetical protein BGX38DRAFT_251696 [Terfezia claveryi]
MEHQGRWVRYEVPLPCTRRGDCGDEQGLWISIWIETMVGRRLIIVLDPPWTVGFDQLSITQPIALQLSLPWVLFCYIIIFKGGELFFIFFVIFTFCLQLELYLFILFYYVFQCLGFAM